MKKAESAPLILKQLKKIYPDARCALNYETPFQLLIATLLSAQTTDEKVNQVTPSLFKDYPTPFQMSQAPLEDVENKIRSVNYYKTKAKHILQTSEILTHTFNQILPQTIEELITLPGVGRKTANVVLGNAFGITSGIVVDTHVGRLSRRMGWTKQESPEKVEGDLKKIIKKSDWILISHLLIYHGRQKCLARNPKCQECQLKSLCLRRL